MSTADAARSGGNDGGLLSLQKLTVARGNRDVVRGVSIEIPAGEVTTLLGPNGAGKSSMVLAIAGVLKPRSGSVLLDGRDITGQRPERDPAFRPRRRSGGTAAAA